MKCALTSTTRLLRIRFTQVSKIMTYSDQNRKPSWIDDDNWTTQKTDWEFEYLLEQWDRRELTNIEKEWIQSLIPNINLSDQKVKGRELESA